VAGRETDGPVASGPAATGTAWEAGPAPTLDAALVRGERDG